MTVTELHPVRSVFSTEAVDPHDAGEPAERAADLAAELLRASELCRLAAGLLTGDAHPTPSRVDDVTTPGGAPSPTGPRWSLQPVRPDGRPAT